MSRRYGREERYGRYGGYGYWAPYVSVGQKLANGKAAAKKRAKKEKRDPQPVEIEGQKIARKFWGLQWCGNLERHRDISNRLPRGATYVRNGSVADLVVEKGKVRAIVAGSEAYEVEIAIKPLPAKRWKQIVADCSREIGSLLDLLQGRLSDDVMRRLTQTDGGLLPAPKEMSTSCTCPDFATVCKHVAAVYYGVGARLDTRPELLFTLRGVDQLELIQQADGVNLDEALKSDGEQLGSNDLQEIFGVDLAASSPPKPKRRRQSASTARPAPADPVEPPALPHSARRKGTNSPGKASDRTRLKSIKALAKSLSLDPSKLLRAIEQGLVAGLDATPKTSLAKARSNEKQPPLIGKARGSAKRKPLKGASR